MMEKLIENKINELIEKDIIESVQNYSAWQSLIVPVKKANGQMRLCVDMRSANKGVLRQ